MICGIDPTGEGRIVESTVTLYTWVKSNYIIYADIQGLDTTHNNTKKISENITIQRAWSGLHSQCGLVSTVIPMCSLLATMCIVD